MKNYSDIETISWLTESKKASLISWFTNKMDILVSKLSLLDYNTESNCLSDITKEIRPMAQIAVAPTLDSKGDDFEFGMMLSVEVVNQMSDIYCEKKFDKVTKY